MASASTRRWHWTSADDYYFIVTQVATDPTTGELVSRQLLARINLATLFEDVHAEGIQIFAAKEMSGIPGTFNSLWEWFEENVIKAKTVSDRNNALESLSQFMVQTSVEQGVSPFESFFTNGYGIVST